MWARLGMPKLNGLSWLKKDEDGHRRWSRSKSRSSSLGRRPSSSHAQRAGAQPVAAPPVQAPGDENVDASNPLHRRTNRKAIPGLPRPITFRRQNSEMRDKLQPLDTGHAGRRARSADKRFGGGPPQQQRRTLSPPGITSPSFSAPDISRSNSSEGKTSPTGSDDETHGPPRRDGEIARQLSNGDGGEQDRPSVPPPLSTGGELRGMDDSSSAEEERLLQAELDAKWILNLSMHFRDRSDREKFFVTYAEQPNRWRRITISCDYRNMEPDSLESDLKGLHYQRDKIARIYESIRDSLPDIQFYDTVTNLKLQTEGGRLHVHVTEDVNEIIQYPSINAVRHLNPREFPESSVRFDSHISGFVYKVAASGRTYIKKEIPGPDTVEEFLYEINALGSLRDSESVIRFEGLVVDDRGELIKGLLISYAEQGALVDLLYDLRDLPQLSLARRERWAQQIVQGLSEIHEAGFVQGDFTLSNIVVDDADNAKIIDINRRGCPVGWEPPELSRLIERGQRISLYIGVKSDLFQLGMVLWALAEEEDEPERQERPLRFTEKGMAAPQYYRDMVHACLSEDARERRSAKELLACFPRNVEDAVPAARDQAARHSWTTHRSDKEYIDPNTAVDLEDISRFRSQRHAEPATKRSDPNFLSSTATSRSYRFGSSTSFIAPAVGGGRSSVSHESPSSSSSRHRMAQSSSPNRMRGRHSIADPHRDYSPYPSSSAAAGTRLSARSLDDSELGVGYTDIHACSVGGVGEATDEHDMQWEQVYVDGEGTTTLIRKHREHALNSLDGVVDPVDHDAEEVTCKDDELSAAVGGVLPLPRSPTANTVTPTATSPQAPLSPTAISDTATTTKSASSTTPVHASPPPLPAVEKFALSPTPPQPPNDLVANNSCLQPTRASFHERVQQQATQGNVLADLEREVLTPAQPHFFMPPPPTEPLPGGPSKSVQQRQQVPPLVSAGSLAEFLGSAGTTTAIGTVFGPPQHHDSGFSESPREERAQRISEEIGARDKQQLLPEQRKGSISKRNASDPV